MMRIITLVIFLFFASGTFANSNAAPQTSAAVQGSHKTFEPIFEPAEGHDAPVANISSYDLSILGTCGSWGSHVSENDLLKMFRKASNRPTMTKMFDSLEHRVLGSKELTFAEFTAELSSLLGRNQGFSHIFCGVSRHGAKSTIGLHYFARIFELQDKGFIGKNTTKKCSNSDFKGPEYTVPVDYIIAGTNKIGSQCKISFVNDLHGDTMIIELVKAVRTMSGSKQLKELDKKGRPQRLSCYHCVKNTSGDNKICFNTVVGGDPIEVVSFYPNTNGCVGHDTCNLCSVAK